MAPDQDFFKGILLNDPWSLTISAVKWTIQKFDFCGDFGRKLVSTYAF